MKISVFHAPVVYSQIEIDEEATVADLKMIMDRKIGRKNDRFKFIFDGSVLSLSRQLKSYGISDGDMIQARYYRSEDDSEDKDYDYYWEVLNDPTSNKAGVIKYASSGSSASKQEVGADILNHVVKKLLSAIMMPEKAGDTLDPSVLHRFRASVMKNPFMKELIKTRTATEYASSVLEIKNVPYYTGEFTDDQFLKIFGLQRTPEINAHLANPEVRNGIEMIKKGIRNCGGPEIVYSIVSSPNGPMMSFKVQNINSLVERQALITELKNLGFQDEEKIVTALQKAGNDLDTAIKILRGSDSNSRDVKDCQKP